MAVVSISRIQVRRGRANEGTGLPQLASGEFGWAIDTQELYIGNGSTAEGAPAVGNTQILTTNSNVIDLVGQYTYKSGTVETSESGPVQRTISERLDDRVSLKAFGGPPAERLQKALYELYLNTQNTSATGTPLLYADSAPVLHIEPGVYEISETVYLPPFTTIVGAGKGKTVFKKTGDFDLFRTVSSDTEYNGTLGSSIERYDPNDDNAVSVANQARNIRIEHLTLDAGSSTGTSSLLKLSSCRNSEFNNVQFISDDDPTSVTDLNSGISIESKSKTVTTKDNTFTNCDFNNLNIAVDGQTDVTANTFNGCVFANLKQGIMLGNESTGVATNNLVHNCSFDNILKEAFVALGGTGNKSKNNSYGSNVGLDNSVDTVSSVVKFDQPNNFSEDDSFASTEQAAIVQKSSGVEYHPEVAGPVSYTNSITQTVDVGGTELLFRLPGDSNKLYSIEYTFVNSLETFQRSGTATLILKKGSTPATSTATLSDQYDYFGEDGSRGFSILFTSSVNATTGSIEFNSNQYGSGPDTTGDGFGNGVGGKLTFKITSKSLMV